MPRLCFCMAKRFSKIKVGNGNAYKKDDACLFEYRKTKLNVRHGVTCIKTQLHVLMYGKEVFKDIVRRGSRQH